MKKNHQNTLQHTEPESLVALIHHHGNPHASAIAAPTGKPLTYSDLIDQIGYTGAVLRTLGAGKSDTVVVILPEGPGMACTFMGVASHFACAPLNPRLGRDDLAFYLSDLKPAAIIIPDGVDSPARDLARESGIPILDVMDLSEGRAGEFRFKGFESAPEPTEKFAGGDDIALILYTSGTTSRPKMVPLSHKNLCASAGAIARTLALIPNDRCLNMMPLFHIHGLVGVLLSSLYAGGSIICTPGFDGEQFPGWLSSTGSPHGRPTWYSAVPTIHQAALASVRESPTRPDHDLRLIRSSSAALSPAIMTELESVFGVPVIESYGMTEAAHQMASNPLPPGHRKPGSVGLPAGPEVSIMDDDGNLLPTGAIGEIVICGSNVTAGYGNNPDANAAAFTGGWFRTGDLGRFDEEGYLFITSRKKEMINRGGENISPREIDDVLLTHDAVRQAVAFAVPHPSLGEDVAAAVILNAKGATTESELRRFVFQHLAAFKVPSRILIVDVIPTGPTGKPQRIGLARALEAYLEAEYIAPRTDLERDIAAVIGEILEADRIGMADNFFALGGDSLKATRVIAKLSGQYQVDLPATALFLNPTPEEFAQEITLRLGEASGEMEALLAEIEGMSEEDIRGELGRGQPNDERQR